MTSDFLGLIFALPMAAAFVYCIGRFVWEWWLSPEARVYRLGADEELAGLPERVFESSRLQARYNSGRADAAAAYLEEISSRRERVARRRDLDRLRLPE